MNVLAQARRHPYLLAGGLSAAALIIASMSNRDRAKKAEHDNPPVGNFIEVQGVRLHYVDQGEGQPLVLLHGNGSMIQDFASSGLIDKAAARHRVIVFDRPGFGYSDRPRRTIWSPEAQAELLHEALARIGVSSAIVVGHSWGTSVAIAMAQRFSTSVDALVLLSGYFYPSARLDSVLLSGPAIPGVGDILSHTIAPLINRAMWPLTLRKLFGPAPVARKFAGFPKEMAFRASQIRASAAESALTIPDAYSASGDYDRLKMPVVIVAGEQDRVVDVGEQSERLHEAIPHSTFHRVQGSGHMVHQTATDTVMAAIDEAGKAILEGRSGQKYPYAA